MPAPRRRQSWLKSQSDSFGPIKQVGVAISIGLPLFVIGVLMIVLLIFSIVGIETSLWILAAALFVAGLAAAISRRIL